MLFPTMPLEFIVPAKYVTSPFLSMTPLTAYPSSVLHFLKHYCVLEHLTSLFARPPECWNYMPEPACGACLRGNRHPLWRKRLFHFDFSLHFLNVCG